MFCKKCGSMIENGECFCKNCGSRAETNSITTLNEEKKKMLEKLYLEVCNGLGHCCFLLKSITEETKTECSVEEKKAYHYIVIKREEMVSCFDKVIRLMEFVMTGIDDMTEVKSFFPDGFSLIDIYERLTEEVKDFLVFCIIKHISVPGEEDLNKAVDETERLYFNITKFFDMAEKEAYNTFFVSAPKPQVSIKKNYTATVDSCSYVNNTEKPTVAKYGVKGSPKKGVLKWFTSHFKKEERPVVETLTVPEFIFEDSNSQAVFSEPVNRADNNSIDMNSFSVSDVQFSAVVKKNTTRGEYIPIDIVMYEDEFRRIIDEKLEYGEREVKGGYFRMAHQSIVKVVLAAKGVEIDNEEEKRIWQGKYLDFSFLVLVPENYEGKQICFCATVYVNDVIATKLKFIVDVKTSEKQKIKIEREDITTAFVSYSSDDRIRVASIVQGMQKARPDLDLFMDVESLRSGDDWETELKNEINKRSVFYLCWSKAAKASKWVDFEWRYALEQKGDEYIEPVPIDPPEICAPPEELNKKHFNDKMVYVVKALEYMHRKTAYITVKENNCDKKFCINKERFVIGRVKGEADCCIANRKVSKVHAEITKENGEYFITDLGTTNKTYVDDVECTAGVKVPVGDGSVIRLADEVILFELK